MEAYYWESVIMLRKVLLNVVLVVMATASPLAQALVILFVLQSFAVAHMLKMPYADSMLNRIEMGSFGVSVQCLVCWAVSLTRRCRSC